MSTVSSAGAAVVLALLAAGCGGGSKPPRVARIGTTTTTAQSSSARRGGALYASCMRAHGIPDFPDPRPGGSFDIAKGIKQEPQFPTASRSCQNDLPAPRSSAKHPNVREQIKFARCIRSHGIANFPDPLPGGGWNLPNDVSSPQFNAAAHACRKTGIHWNGP